MEKEVYSKSVSSYLTFKIGDEIFAANVIKVLNILELQDITAVPQSPEYMKGVINLRGVVLPVIDSKIKFGMEATEFTNNTCILVLDVNIDDEGVEVGALVDAVLEVLEIEESKIQQPPSIGSKYRTEFLEGMVNFEDKFIMILNMDMVFSTNELVLLQEKATEGANEIKEVETQD